MNTSAERFASSVVASFGIWHKKSGEVQSIAGTDEWHRASTCLVCHKYGSFDTFDSFYYVLYLFFVFRSSGMHKASATERKAMNRYTFLFVFAAVPFIFFVVARCLSRARHSQLRLCFAMHTFDSPLSGTERISYNDEDASHCSGVSVPPFLLFAAEPNISSKRIIYLLA